MTTSEREAADEAGTWVERYGRAGYAVKGIVYVLIGALSFQFAIGVGGRTAGASGALTTIVRQPFGRIMLLATAVGLFGYALWRLVQALLDVENKGRDARGLLKRFGYLVAGVAYGGLGFEAIWLAFGFGTSAGGNSTELWTSRVLSAPLGGWLVGAGAAVMAGLAINAAVVAFGRLYRKKLQESEMTPFASGLADVTAIYGLLARGAVFALVGVLLTRAALRHDAEAAGSSEEALELLVGWPAGPYLLGAVAAGLVAYGVYAMIQARYRRMDVDAEDIVDA